MRAQRIGAAVAVVGAVYLVAVGWMSSWWHVPALTDAAQRGLPEPGGLAFSILWGVAGVLAPIVIALGVAIAARIGALRLLVLAAASALLMLWLDFWWTPAHNPVIFGVGGGLIVLFFLWFCLEWARTRNRLEGSMRTAADLRLGANVTFLIAAWGLCGLLGAPTFLLRPEVTAIRGAPSMAVKVLVCLVLGWGLSALAQTMERRAR